jgi:HK97 family phage portal protein
MGFLNTLVGMASPGLSKGSALPSEGPTAIRQPKAVLFDPLSLSHSMGYKDRKTSLSYDLLKSVSNQLSVVGAIINTRVNQVATFTAPHRQTNTVGFEIKHKDREHKISPREKRYIMDLESFMVNCGRPDQNPYTSRPRDNFDQFTRKVIRDRMTFDALTFENIPDRKGDIFEFVAVDASTIRLAADHNIPKKDLSTEEFQNIKPFMNSSVYLSDFDFPRTPNVSGGKQAGYVQVWQGSVVRAFTYGELAYGVANPRTDVYVNGYGYSEIEQLLDIVTAQLWAEQYNKNFFKQGAAPKGMINIRGENIPPEQLEAFKRAWAANISGVGNSWKTPVLQSEEVQYLNLQSTNMEMEYSRWIEYLIKLICAVYLIAPEEIGFDFSSGGMAQPMVESNNEWKMKASKDRGLRPLLKYYADVLNRNIIDKIDDKYYLDFVGLDELTEKERIELRQQQVQYFRTMNEIRKDEDLEPDPDGDIILNPAFLQWKQMQHQWGVEKEQRADQKKQQEQQQKMQEQQQVQQQKMQEQQMSVQQKQASMQHNMQHRQLTLQEKQHAAQQEQSQQQMAMQQQGAPEQGQQPPEQGQQPPEQGQQPPEQGQQPPEQQVAPGQVSHEDIKSFLDSLPPETLEKM